MRQLVLDKMRREGVTQEKLAELLHIRQEHISRHLTGKRKPDAETRNKYAKWLGLDTLEWN